jgi:hypothetical protein
VGAGRRLVGLALVAAARCLDRLDGRPVAGRYATRFGAGFGTLYTAEYRPAEGSVSYHWPECTWIQSLDDLRPGTIQVRLGGH